jgi:hypothetical protein
MNHSGLQQFGGSGERSGPPSQFHNITPESRPFPNSVIRKPSLASQLGSAEASCCLVHV